MHFLHHRQIASIDPTYPRQIYTSSRRLQIARSFANAINNKCIFFSHLKLTSSFLYQQMTSLLDVIAECEDNKEVLQDLQGRKYTQEIISGTLNMDSLSHSQMIEAMRSALFLNYPIDGMWEEFLFRIGNDYDLKTIYYTFDKRYRVTNIQYTPSARMPRFIIDALTLKYGPPPYEPEHLNMTANLNMTRAAQIGNFTLFKRFYTSAHRQDSVYNLECFKYATLDVDWKEVPSYSIGLWLEHAVEAQQPEVFHIILAETQMDTVPAHIILRIITKDAVAFVQQIPHTKDRQIHEHLSTCMHNKAINCFKALLARASEQYTNHPNTAKQLYDDALWITSTQGLQMLLDAGIKPHQGTYKLKYPRHHLQWLRDVGVEWSQIELPPHPISSPADIKLFDECNFDWPSHTITELTDTPHEAVILRLLDRKCQWDSSLYTTLSGWYGATGSVIVKMHAHAVENKLLDKQLTPQILPTLRRLQPGELNRVAQIFHHATCSTCGMQKQQKQKKDWLLCHSCYVAIACSAKCASKHKC